MPMSFSAVALPVSGPLHLRRPLCGGAWPFGLRLSHFRLSVGICLCQVHGNCSVLQLHIHFFHLCHHTVPTARTLWQASLYRNTGLCQDISVECMPHYSMEPHSLSRACKVVYCNAACAPAVQVMKNFTGSDKFGLEIVVPKGYLPSEKDVPFKVPAMDVTLYCKRPALHG